MTEFFIVDLRPEWRGNPYVTLWRPDDAGYAYPLPWAGRYSKAQDMTETAKRLAWDVWTSLSPPEYCRDEEYLWDHLEESTRKAFIDALSAARAAQPVGEVVEKKEAPTDFDQHTAPYREGRQWRREGAPKSGNLWRDGRCRALFEAGWDAQDAALRSGEGR